MNTLYGVPNAQLERALRQEMETIGMTDEEARRALQAHPLVDLLHAINTIIQKPHSEQLEAMQKWLLGEFIPSSKKLAREQLADIKGVLNASKANANRGTRTRGIS